MPTPGLNRTRLLLLVVLAGLLLPATASAARNCRIRVTDVAFGTYMPGAASNVDVAGNIRVRCNGRPSPGQPNSYSLLIDGGQNGTPADRRLRNGLVNLAYNLFQDAARAVIWGDGTAGTSGVSQAISGRRFRMRHTVYGRVYSGQYPDSGTYADVPTVTIEF